MSLLTPDDDTYHRAREARLGERRLPEVYDAFVAAVEHRLGVRPLWLEIDRFDRPGGGGTRARLQVVVERQAERRVFLGPRGTLGARTRRVLADLLVEHVDASHLHEAFGRPAATLPDDVVVLVPAFEPVALRQVHRSVPRDELDAFGRSLGLGERLWTIERLFGPPVVFLHTRDQVAEVLATDEPDRWADAYLRLAAAYDELGYLRRDGLVVGVDSKQVLDEDFSGRWQYYWR